MEKDSDYSEILLSSLNNLRNSDFICDFTVKVGNESFSVHRAVLAAASKYFTAMFSSDMKEIREEFVDIKELDVEGVRQCIEYMYTGGIKPDNKTVQHTLKASHLIQLDGLTSICFRFLRKHISVETCLTTVKLSSLYDRHDAHELAENFILENFDPVTLTEMFPSITKSDLLHYIGASKATYEVTWQALVRWFSVEREKTSEILLELMKSTEVTSFPFEYLLDTVLEEPIVKQNQSCQNLVIMSLFSDIDTLKSSLTTENFFVVKSLAMAKDIPNAEKSRKIFEEYLESNFEKLSKNEGFCDLTEKEVIDLFRSSKTEYSSEKIKWDTARVWIKHDELQRKKIFLKLFKLLRLDLFSREFLRETVLNETLVKESSKCKDLLLKMLLVDKTGDSKALTPHIACLDTTNGDITALNLKNNQWKGLPSLQLNEITTYHRVRVIVNVNNKMFCLDDKNLHQFDQIQMMWIQKQSLETQPTNSGLPLSFQQQICVVDRDFTACYSVTDEVWNENLPGCKLDGDFCVASCNGIIYAMGGYKNGNSIADAKRFHPESHSWIEIAPLGTSRNLASAATFHEMIFVIGGIHGNTYLDSVEMYVPLVNTWTSVKSMCRLRKCPYACVADNRLFAVGGSCDEEGELLDTDSIEVYDEEKREWDIVRNDIYGGGYIPCCVINLADDVN